MALGSQKTIMGSMMRRREFIAGLGSGAAWPLIARAQQSAVSVIGYLGVGPNSAPYGAVAALLRGMSELGYVEGRNLAVEYRSLARCCCDRLIGGRQLSRRDPRQTRAGRISGSARSRWRFGRAWRCAERGLTRTDRVFDFTAPRAGCVVGGRNPAREGLSLWANEQIYGLQLDLGERQSDNDRKRRQKHRGDYTKIQFGSPAK